MLRSAISYNQSRDLKLFGNFGREIIFEVFQPVWKTYLNVTGGHRRTDRQTRNLITAHCVASRGKTVQDSGSVSVSTLGLQEITVT